MKHIIWALAFALAVAVPVAAAGPAVPINDLIEQAKMYDGETVTVQGEVVGDVMIRDERGWVNISDGTNDIGIWAPAELLRRIGFVGRYHTRGDTVRVTGTFYRADPQQGGDLDIRASSLDVVKPGERVDHVIPSGRLILALGSLGVAAGLGLWLRSRAGL